MSGHALASEEISFASEASGNTKKIWRVFWILTGLTIAELILGLLIYNVHKGADPSAALVLFFKGVVCILTLAKAYFIVSHFMHLGDEIRNMVMTIIVPLFLFVWFIIAFLKDGSSWKDMRNTDAGSKVYIESPVQHPAMAKPGEK